jgi:hypothetical protein
MNDEPIDPLDSLANQAEQLTNAPPIGEELDQAQQAEADQAAQQEAQAMKMLEDGTVRVLHYLSKLGRGRLARGLPEIMDEWTDDALLAPCEASIPLIRKHMAFLLTTMGSSPELAMFAMSLLPLLFGLMSAQERHEKMVAEMRRRAAEQMGTGEVTDVNVVNSTNSETPVAA